MTEFRSAICENVVQNKKKNKEPEKNMMSSHAHAWANIINNQTAGDKWCARDTVEFLHHRSAVKRSISDTSKQCRTNITRKHRTFDAPMHTDNNTGYIWQSAAHHRHTKNSARKFTRQNAHIHYRCTFRRMHICSVTVIAWNSIRKSTQNPLQQFLSHAHQAPAVYAISVAVRVKYAT